MKKILVLITAMVAILGISACSKNEEPQAAAEKKELVFGGSAMPYGIVFEKGIKPIMEKKGYKFEMLNFSSLELNNAGVNDGNVDFNLDQHTAYLKVYNKNKNAHLFPLVHIPLVPAALYSEKYRSLDEAPNSATILIPNDTSNTSRALRVLEKSGVIKIKAGADPVLLTVNDIAENPKNLKIKEMDSVIIPRALPDVDFGFASGGIAYQSKLDPKKVVLREDVIPELEMVVAIHEKNKDTQWAKDLKESYESQEFKDFMKEYNKDGMWVMPKS